MSDKGLENAYSKLNPIFELQNVSETFAKHLNTDFIT